MFWKVMKAFLIVVVMAAATVGVLYVLYDTFILGSDTPLRVIVSFFAVILYSNILSKLWLAFYKVTRSL